MSAARRVLGAAGLAMALAACAPDPSDVYTVDAPTDATLPPLPTTVAPEESDDAAAAADSPDGTTENEAAIETFAPNGVTADVRSLDNSFIAPVIEVEAGTEVQWINGGRNDHNVLPVDDALTWGVEREEFVPGDRYSHVFDQPGVFAYYCSIHGTKEVGMVGAVVVLAPS